MATESAVREVLRTVVDPELGVNIVDLGLVYGIRIENGETRIAMTTTSPMCPLTEYLKDLVAGALHSEFADIERVHVDIVSEPPWTPDMMSDAARAQLSGDG
jgi:metal-sulfur cluster biosynthetic enzyme